MQTFFDFEVRGRTYKFVWERLSQPEARRYCSLLLGDGAALATLDTTFLWRVVVANAKLHRAAVSTQVTKATVPAFRLVTGFFK